MALGRPPSPSKKKNYNKRKKRKKETVKRSVEYAKIKPFFLFLLFQLLFNVVLFARGQSSPPGCRPEILLSVQMQFYLRPQAKQSSGRRRTASVSRTCQQIPDFSCSVRSSLSFFSRRLPPSLPSCRISSLKKEEKKEEFLRHGPAPYRASCSKLSSLKSISERLRVPCGPWENISNIKPQSGAGSLRALHKSHSFSFFLTGVSWGGFFPLLYCH